MLLFENGSAQVANPPVPEFTVQYIEHPYDIPPVTSVNPYTGETTTSPAQRITNASIEITIKNQAIPNSATNEPYILGYNIHMKGHFETDQWQDLYYWNNGTDAITFLSQSENKATFISLKPTFPPNSQVDFQIEAVLGHRVITQIPRTDGWPFEMVDHPIFVIDSTSGWSDSQTVTINPISSATSRPSEGTSVFASIPMLAIVLVLAVTVILLILVVFYLRRRSITKTL